MLCHVWFAPCVCGAASNPTFVATTVFVFTWFAVGRYNAKNDRLNTFQAALASGDLVVGKDFCAGLPMREALLDRRVWRLVCNVLLRQPTV